MKKTVVIGASPNPTRYSYLAVLRLTAANHPVVAVGLRQGSIGNVQIDTTRSMVTDVDTVTLYVNPTNQKAWYDYILSLNPKRIIFNPGTENPELAGMASARGIETDEACTLVLLATNNY